MERTNRHCFLLCSVMTFTIVVMKTYEKNVEKSKFQLCQFICGSRNQNTEQLAHTRAEITTAPHLATR